MRPSGGQPQEEPQVLGPVKGLSLEAPVTEFVSGAPASSSPSYACLDVISFDRFELPRLKVFGGIDREGGHKQESAEEGQMSRTISPMMRPAEPIQLQIPTKDRSKTLKIIDPRSKSPTTWNSTPTTTDTEKGTTGKSNSRELPLAVNSVNRGTRHGQRESSLESCGRPDLTRSMLYNWHLLRMDNIRILDPLWEGFRGSSHDYELLKLLAQTHEHQRWWLIVVDDFACPQCVETLRLQRVHPRVRRPRSTKQEQEFRANVH